MITIEIRKSGEIDFEDRTKSVQWQSLVIRQALTKEVDSCSFSVLKYGDPDFVPEGQDDSYTPENEDEVIISEDGIKVFAGYIVRVSENVLDGPVLEYSAECKDYTHLLDRKLVAKVYKDMTVAEIIDDIVANYSAPGITTTNVDGPEMVDHIVFNNIDPSKCFERLAEIFNKDWYPDYDKDIHFFSKETNLAPFNLDDTTGNYIFGTLNIVRDTTQIKNSILIEGGQELSDVDFFDHWVGNGESYAFKTTYLYDTADLFLSVNGVEKIVGIDGKDKFSDGFDALYNTKNFSLIFPNSSPIPDGQEVIFGGKYWFKIRSLVRAVASINKYGEKQFQIIDTNIQDRDTARERAKAELAAYSSQLSEGGFSSYSLGLRAGQQITIQSDFRDFSEDFLINNLEAKLYTPGKTIWTASIVSTKSFDIIDLLNRLIDKGEVALDTDVVIGTADLLIRGVGVSRAVHRQNDLDIVYVTGPYIPADFSGDPKRACWTNSGCVTN